jgi:hypothetical protein
MAQLDVIDEHLCSLRRPNLHSLALVALDGIIGAP